MIKREDAILLFKKWFSEGTEILCIERRFDASAVFRGRITEMSETEMTLTCGKLASLTLRLRADLSFAYGEPREAVAPESPELKALASVLTVALPLRVGLPIPKDFPPREIISFWELADRIEATQI